MNNANEVIENLKDDKTKKVGNADDFIEQMLHTLGVKNLDAFKNMTWNSNSYNPAHSVIDNINQSIKQIQSVNVKPSVSVGELSLNIQTPVGTMEEIAKHAATGVVERAEREFLMQIPNAFYRQMYTNLK